MTLPLRLRAARPAVWINERFAQQIDAHQHVEFPQTQIADDLDAFHRIDIRMQITHLDAVFGQVIGKILRHALGQRRRQHTFAYGHTQLDFG